MAAQRRRAVAVLRSAALALGLVLLVSACRVDTSVHVDVEDAGSGTVTVVFNADAVAVSRVPELAGGLLFDDARAAGWAVEGPLFRADGGVQIRAVKRFESAGQLPQVLEELAGKDVIFTGVVLEQTRSFAETSYRFQADINPTPPLDDFSDDALAAIFEGQPFGRPLPDLIAEAGTPQDSLGFEFSLTLIDSDDAFSASAGAVGVEGDLDDEMAALSPEVDGSTATWRFFYGDRPVRVGASTMISDTLAPLWLNIARVAGIAFGALLLGVGVAKLVALLRAPRGRGPPGHPAPPAAGRGPGGGGQPPPQAPAAPAGGGRARCDRAAHRPAGGSAVAGDPRREPRHRSGADPRPAPHAGAGQAHR